MTALFCARNSTNPAIAAKINNSNQLARDPVPRVFSCQKEAIMYDARQVDINIYLKDELWHYRIVVRKETFDPRTTSDTIVTQGFSDDFDALLHEALDVAQREAEVLRRE